MSQTVRDETRLEVTMCDFKLLNSSRERVKNAGPLPPTGRDGRQRYPTAIHPCKSKRRPSEENRRCYHPRPPPLKTGVGDQGLGTGQNGRPADPETGPLYEGNHSNTGVGGQESRRVLGVFSLSPLRQRVREFSVGGWGSRYTPPNGLRLSPLFGGNLQQQGLGVRGWGRGLLGSADPEPA